MATKLEEKWDAIEDNPMFMVSELREIWEKMRSEWAESATEFMADEDFGKVLDLAINIIENKVPDHDKIALIIVRLQAYCLTFRVKYSSYMGYMKGTDDANMKKNMYKELYTGTDRLVDALKYMVR